MILDYISLFSKWLFGLFLDPGALCIKHRRKKMMKKRWSLDRFTKNQILEIHIAQSWFLAPPSPIVITLGKISVNRSWKIPQSDHFYINQENGFCQDFVDCNGFFGLRCRLQVNKSVPILIQSRQSCCNSVQSSIVKFLYNPVQSIQSKHNWGTHRGILPKTGISWQTTWGSNPTTIAQAKLTFQNGSMQGSDQPKSLSLHFHNPPQSRNYFFTIGSDCERIMWLQQRQALILICNFTLVTIEKTYFAIQSDCVRILD